MGLVGFSGQLPGRLNLRISSWYNLCKDEAKRSTISRDTGLDQLHYLFCRLNFEYMTHKEVNIHESY